EDRVVEMMSGLYREDPPQKPVNPESFRRTVRHFLDHPEAGRIFEFWSLQEVVGYAIVVPYWSNELGGTLACLDELYVVAGSRRQGIATAFLDHLRRERPFDSVLVMPGGVTRQRAGAAPVSLAGF